MTADSSFAADAARTTARILLEIAAVHFRPQQPFILTSGRASPVYIDCRKIISFPRARRKIIDLAVELIEREVGFESLDAVAGGETAGIPFAAWIADRLDLPMLYIRKKPKGFGRGAQIEGDMKPGARCLLVEDLATDGGSKVNFVNAIRDGEGQVDRRLRRLPLRHLPAERGDAGQARRAPAWPGDLVGHAGGGESQRPAERGRCHGRPRLPGQSRGLVVSPWRQGGGAGLGLSSAAAAPYSSRRHSRPATRIKQQEPQTVFTRSPPWRVPAGRPAACPPRPSADRARGAGRNANSGSESAVRQAAPTSPASMPRSTAESIESTKWAAKFVAMKFDRIAAAAYASACHDCARRRRQRNQPTIAPNSSPGASVRWVNDSSHPASVNCQSRPI